MGANQSDQQNKIVSAYSYQLINSIKEKKFKNLNKEASFNYNSTILLVNQGFTYHVLQIKQQSLKSIAIIQNSMYISSIMCFKKSNTFVAGSLNKLIAIQSLIALNNRKTLYKCNIPIEANCIILNNAEDQVIAGGYQKILILNIKNGLQIHQQLQIYNDWITDLSISEFDTYLAINSNENYILIMEQCVKDTQRIWIEKQKIGIQSNNSKSIFINNNILIIKLKDKELIFIYEFNIQDQLFNYQKQIQLTGKSHKFLVAPLKCNQQLKILAITNKNNVNFIKIINSDNYESQQMIINKNEMIGGVFSQDGVYFGLLTQHKNQVLLYKLMKMREK